MKIPRYKTSGGLQKVSNMPQISAPKQISNAMGNALVKYGDAIVKQEAALRKKMKGIEIENSILSATNSVARANADIDERIRNTTSEDEIKKAKDNKWQAVLNASSLIKDPNERQKWILLQEKGHIANSVTMQNNLYLNQGKEYQQGLNGLKDYTIDESIKNTSHIDAHMNTLKVRLQNGVDKHYIRQDEMDKHIEEAERKIRLGVADKLIKYDPEGSLDSIENNRWVLTEEEKKSKIKDARAQIKERKNLAKEKMMHVQDATFDSYAKLFESGQGATILPSEVEAQYNEKMLSKPDYETIKAMYGADPEAQGMLASEYLNLALLQEKAYSNHGIFNDAKVKDVNRYIEALRGYIAKGFTESGYNNRMTKAEVIKAMNETVMLKNKGVIGIKIVSVKDIVSIPMAIGEWGYHEAARRITEMVREDPEATWSTEKIKEEYRKLLPSFIDREKAMARKENDMPVQAPTKDVISFVDDFKQLKEKDV